MPLPEHTRTAVNQYSVKVANENRRLKRALQQIDNLAAAGILTPSRVREIIRQAKADES